jgi:hypothetical protein
VFIGRVARIVRDDNTYIVTLLVAHFDPLAEVVGDRRAISATLAFVAGDPHEFWRLCPFALLRQALHGLTAKQ